ncbi:hypothetical protein GCM10010404_23630 [Nonomuraea africana]|uniref:Enzyme related to lactoylglutathione lyase n=1 Tax=Nonomuraea africana TaxID=46171 RepID=A0ABR9KCB8_9ACTN|nr:VOC family protein [Nonomuraea africana]MBE1559649.1 putative enzyme related to lactoylglutathione lyase [Nonomuraea africana]
MAVNLGYYTLSVRDLDRAAAFYTALFGWELLREHDTYLHAGNTAVPTGLTVGEPSVLPNLYYQVDDLDAAVELVGKLGGRAGEIQESKTGRFAVVHDDQETCFSLWQSAA